MIALRLTDHFPMRVTDWLLAGILITWGFTAFFISDAEWQSPLYQGINNVQAYVWGMIGISIGIVRMAALFINGAIRRSPHARAIGAFVSAYLWWWLTLAAILSGPIDLAAGIYPWLLIAEVYNVYRASRDARLSDERAKKPTSRESTGNATTARR